MATPSHRLKLDRADQHLSEIEGLTEDLRERREYPVVETMKPQRKSPAWDYTLDLSGVQPPETLPIVVGDYLFDVRSALDHLIVSIAPRKERYRVSFPVLKVDPLARREGSGDYVDSEAAGRWMSLCNRLPDDCIAPLMALQPHYASALHRRPAEHHALALLSSFQNADKHRELVDAVAALGQIELNIDGETTYVAPYFKHGTKVITGAPEKMDVKLEGVATVGIQRGNEVWGFDMLVTRLSDFIQNRVLPTLEPFLR